jgi:hypothetical protein
MEGSESKCLIRATNGKKKISTVVRKDFVHNFLARDQILLLSTNEKITLLTVIDFFQINSKDVNRFQQVIRVTYNLLDCCA